MENDHPFLDRDIALQPKNAVAAILILSDDRYVLQRRDRKRGIFYPDHWGLFGGEIEPGEEHISAIRRELVEELGLQVDDEGLRYFTRFDFDIGFAGINTLSRTFYEVRIDASQLTFLRLGEGQAIGTFDWRDVLKLHPMTPYYSVALWLHINHSALEQ